MSSKVFQIFFCNHIYLLAVLPQDEINNKFLKGSGCIMNNKFNF